MTAAEPHAAQPGRTSWARLLLTWRTVPGFGTLEWVVLSAFFLVGAFALHVHEPWDDEAQAWLIARDSSLWNILRTRLHYEGAPPLWHTLLYLFHAAHGGYDGIGWLSLLFATAGVFVWLRWAPLPAAVRALVPFTFFLQYQYAVIARPYVLFPLLIFAVCVVYAGRTRLLLFAFLLGLIANISLHGFMVALAFLALYAFDRLETPIRARLGRPASAMPVVRWSRPPFGTAPRGRVLAAALLFAVMTSVSIYSAIPAPDLDFAIGDHVSTGLVHQVLMQIVGETPRNAPRDPPEAPLPSPPYAQASAARWAQQPGAALARLIYPPGPPPPDHAVLRWVARSLGEPLLEVADVAVWTLADFSLLAAVFLLVALVWFYRVRRLIVLLPYAALLLAGVLLWTAEHHAGMVFVALLAALWLGYLTSERPDIESSKLNTPLLSLLYIVLAVQIGWSIYSIHADAQGNYDPGQETAQWLKGHRRPRMAAFGFATVSIQPWFAKSPFFDTPTSYWLWSSNVEVDGIHQTIIATHPDLVVYGVEFPGYGQIRNQLLPLTDISQDEERWLPRDHIVHDLREAGYHETHRFCGARFARFSSSYRVCDLVFEPLPEPAAQSAIEPAQGR